VEPSTERNQSSIANVKMPEWVKSEVNKDGKREVKREVKMELKRLDPWKSPEIKAKRVSQLSGLVAGKAGSSQRDK
jgi:hypothetical protein